MFSNLNKLLEWLDVVVTIVCWHKMALVLFLKEDEDVPSVYHNLKIFCETAPRPFVCTQNQHHDIEIAPLLLKCLFLTQEAAVGERIA